MRRVVTSGWPRAEIWGWVNLSEVLIGDSILVHWPLWQTVRGMKLEIVILTQQVLIYCPRFEVRTL
jgi:hypothetical protein